MTFFAESKTTTKLKAYCLNGDFDKLNGMLSKISTDQIDTNDIKTLLNNIETLEIQEKRNENEKKINNSTIIKRRYRLYEDLRQLIATDDDKNKKGCRNYVNKMFSKINSYLKPTAERFDLRLNDVFIDLNDNSTKPNRNYILNKRDLSNVKMPKQPLALGQKKHQLLNQFKSQDHIRKLNVNYKKPLSKEKFTYFDTHRKTGNKVVQRKTSVTNFKDAQKQKQRVLKCEKKPVSKAMMNSNPKNIMKFDHIKKQLSDIKGKSHSRVPSSENQIETVRIHNDADDAIQEESIIKLKPEKPKESDKSSAQKPPSQLRQKNFKRCKSNEHMVVPHIASCNALNDHEKVYKKHKKTFSSGVEKNVIIEELFLNDSSSNIDEDNQQLYVR